MAELEILTPMPTFYSHCRHCMVMMETAGLNVNQQTLEDYPKEVQDDYFRLCRLVEDLRKHFGNLTIKVTDPTTIEGILKCIKYKTRTFPSFIVGGKKICGWHQKEALIEFIRNVT